MRTTTNDNLDGFKASAWVMEHLGLYASLFKGKTLYRNGRRDMKIAKVARIPDEPGCVCLCGRDFYEYGPNDAYLFVTADFMEQMRYNGENNGSCFAVEYTRKGVLRWELRDN